MERGKTNFSKEVDGLKKLIAQLEKADSTKQKGIRAKLRKMGLYWSEIGQGMSYTIVNFDKLVNLGVIKIRKNPSNFSSSVKSKPISSTEHKSPVKKAPMAKGRVNSDEYYVIDLCDEVLGEKALRQAKFDFLKGDKGHYLPVDAYYENKKIVVEYHEHQHTESEKLFDRKMTVSGVTRDEQRRRYDERRMIEFPKHGIDVIVISYSDFGTSKKLKRDREKDLDVVRKILKKVAE